jgi:uroporphyrinogen III methyltransferase / synthase
MAIRLICRSSRLSLIQAEEIKSFLPVSIFELIPVKSLGDKNKHVPLENNNISDFFTRELDEALLNHEADIAVHSAKDLPYPIPQGLEVIALTAARDQSDSLVSRNNIKLSELPANPRIGTSSVIRAESIRALRPDTRIVSIRGTIEERISLIEKDQVDAVVVATCALQRLGLESSIAEKLPLETHSLQGHLAVVGREGEFKMKDIFSPIDIRKNYGKVFLAGFGPGDPELLTLKTYKALQEANVIFYDDLIEKSYLKNFKAQAIYVGKRKGNHSHTQDQINQLLYKSVIEGKNTVRLKGGDPFIFGRGGEEFEYLHQRLITPVVIPGITAAVGAAAQAGIPLTNRGESSSVSFNTASSQKEINVPQTDTLVYYMGASNLKELREKLLENNVDPQTPAVIITNASQPYASATFTKAGELPDETASPSVVMIGKTIKNRNIMKTKPSVLVTGLTADQYQNLGNVIHQPLIEIVPIEMPENFFRFIQFVNNYKYIIFTSRNSVKHFMEWVNSIGCSANSLSSNTIVSIGAVTTTELLKHGITPNIQPELDSSHGIIELFRSQGITGEEILIPRSDIALNILPDGLRALGNNVHVITVYYTQAVKKIEKVDLTKIDIIVFTSPSGVKSFLKHYGEVPYHVQVVTRGEQTKEAYERNSALYI